MNVYCIVGNLFGILVGGINVCLCKIVSVLNKVLLLLNRVILYFLYIFL